MELILPRDNKSNGSRVYVLMALFPYTPITQQFKLHENNDISGDNIYLSVRGQIELYSVFRAMWSFP